MRAQSDRWARATASAADVTRPSFCTGSDLDPTVVGHRVPGHVVDGLVEVVALEEVVAQDPLLRLGVRTVRAPGPGRHGPGRWWRPRRGLQGVAADADATALALGEPLVDVRVRRSTFPARRRWQMNSMYSIGSSFETRYAPTTIGGGSRTTHWRIRSAT